MHCLPRSSLGLLLVAAALLGTPAGAVAAGMLPDNLTPAGALVGTLTIPDGLTLEEARESVIVSVVARKYTLKNKGDFHVIGHLNNNGHEATMTFVLKPGVIDFYCEGFAVNRKGERKKPETPHGWIKNLRNDITRRMETKLATK